MRELNMDTQRQNFWKESINNEVLIRNRWFQQHIGDGFKPQDKPRNVIKVRICYDKGIVTFNHNP